MDPWEWVMVPFLPLFCLPMALILPSSAAGSIQPVCFPVVFLDTVITVSEILIKNYSGHWLFGVFLVPFWEQRFNFTDKNILFMYVYRFRCIPYTSVISL